MAISCIISEMNCEQMKTNGRFWRAVGKSINDMPSDEIINELKILNPRIYTKNVAINDRNTKILHEFGWYFRKCKP